MAGLTPQDDIFGKASPNNGKSDAAGSAGANPLCPQCHSQRVWKDAKRQNSFGFEIQRWYCRDCGRRFSDPNDVEKAKKEAEKLRATVDTVDTKLLKSKGDIVTTRQICVTAKETKNLVAEPQTTEVLRRNEAQADAKGKIVDFSFWMLKEAYSQATIKTRTKILKRLMKLGADIFNAESVKETIAKQQWSNARKCIAIDAYTSFLQMQGLKWEPPIYNRIRKLPFIPTENEADQLIGGCNKRMATFLQLLKETGVRCGEACQLKWKDVDIVNGCIIVTPEKGSNSRKLKISNKLIAMLNELPKTSIAVFATNTDALRKSFQHQRKLIAYKLKNPRLQQISFHTFRHWKATMEYHKTRDILHVMQLLGHRSIRNTLVYTQLIDFRDDDYVARVAHSEQEACQLIESGFEFVCDFNGNKIFRKRK
ncbi:MAG: tyrosine-type recombinase/integrase [Candidatus Bathyarchaeia archaeon]